ncbi:unnamed protein product, partial [Closterium sp. Naga37s-1]
MCPARHANALLTPPPVWSLSHSTLLSAASAPPSAPPAQILLVLLQVGPAGQHQ